MYIDNFMYFEMFQYFACDKGHGIIITTTISINSMEASP